VSTPPNELQAKAHVADAAQPTPQPRKAPHAGARQSLLLRFASPELESKYVRWYGNGQLSMDLAFLGIAIMAQAAWVFRWGWEGGALGTLMLALMLFNAGIMYAETLAPRAYLAAREEVAAAAHVVHKLVQLAVTVAPGVGTARPPTYTTTGAQLLPH
jgi:hypothetical protein